METMVSISDNTEDKVVRLNPISYGEMQELCIRLQVENYTLKRRLLELRGSAD